MPYIPCTPKELKSFCIQRGLQLHSKKPKKAVLLAVLHKADEHATFDHFLDLPTELRVQIYEIYFSSFRHLDQPVQPPISKVSRLIRQESLPIFYSTCTFILDIGRCKSRNDSEKTSSDIYKFTEGDFFADMFDEHLRLVKRLRIESWLRDENGSLGDFVCTIDLGNGTTPMSAQATRNKYEDLKDNLVEYLKEIEDSPGGPRFEKKDIHVLKKFFKLKSKQNE